MWSEGVIPPADPPTGGGGRDGGVEVFHTEIPAFAGIVLVNHIGDRIGVCQVSHPSSGRSPGVVTTVGA